MDHPTERKIFGFKLPPKTIWTKRAKSDLRTGLLFLSPWLIGFFVFTLYPMIVSFYYSFTIYHSKRAPEWVWFQNYTDLIADDKFWISLNNTLYMVAIAVPLGLFASFLCALLLNLKVRGQAFYRVVYFLPSIVPTVAGTILFLWLLNPQVGLVNTMLAKIGIDGPNWMADPNWSKPALILLGMWGMGGTIIIYLSGLQDVPQSLIEAAEPDGFAHHTLQPHHGHDRHVPIFCASLRGRWRRQSWASAQLHVILFRLSISERLPIFEDGLCLCDGVDPLHHHFDSDSVAPQSERQIYLLRGMMP
jgi:ABC-type spermidine/putrescine transport system permease subunit II